ncbi:unnamed protein product [Hymenolepis diminuta]|uniref:Uncharacterized protein n=1 Tax=Hymenolepis diminuta TaxID=6216 RepID=A0A564Y441_HYMDI|nr:unnamed protein product [Hymenolepis diminuta]
MIAQNAGKAAFSYQWDLLCSQTRLRGLTTISVLLNQSKEPLILFQRIPTPSCLRSYPLSPPQPVPSLTAFTWYSSVIVYQKLLCPETLSVSLYSI